VKSLRVAAAGTSPLDSTYGNLTLTLVITNTSASKTYGVGLFHHFYDSLTLLNKRNEEFKAFRISGIETGFGDNDGRFQGSLTEIAPRGAIVVIANAQGSWSAGRPGDFRPYYLQAPFVFAEQQDGAYPNQKKYNLVVDIK
jgi:hypothetical protein